MRCARLPSFAQTQGLNFFKVTFLCSPQWRHAEHLTFTRESCLLVPLAYSEVWARGSELYCDSTEIIMTHRREREKGGRGGGGGE